MTNANKPIRAFCNKCQGGTNHSLLYEHREKADEPDGDDDFVRSLEISWELLKCCGCDDIKLRHSFQYLDSSHPRECYYPPIEKRRIPYWSDKLPEELKELQQEVYSAINVDNRRLAAMGARTLIDMAICEKVGDPGTFKDKLDAMEREKYLNYTQRGILETALDAGSAASHRGHNPTPNDIDKVMEIVENLLGQLFYLPKLEEELKQTVPRRTTRKKGEK